MAASTRPPNTPNGRPSQAAHAGSSFNQDPVTSLFVTRHVPSWDVRDLITIRPQMAVATQRLHGTRGDNTRRSGVEQAGWSGWSDGVERRPQRSGGHALRVEITGEGPTLDGAWRFLSKRWGCVVSIHDGTRLDLSMFGGWERGGGEGEEGATHAYLYGKIFEDCTLEARREGDVIRFFGLMCFVVWYPVADLRPVCVCSVQDAIFL